MTTKSSKTPYLLRGQTLRSTGLFQMDTPIQVPGLQFSTTQKRNCEEYITYLCRMEVSLPFFKNSSLMSRKNQII